MGLTGPPPPLPSYLSNLAAQMNAMRDTTMNGLSQYNNALAQQSPTAQQFQQYLNAAAHAPPDTRKIVEVIVPDNLLANMVAVRGDVSMRDLETLREYLVEQLPADLRAKLRVEIRTDAFMLSPRVLFVDQNRKKWETGLEEDLKIPGVFLAFLAVSVP
jgi:hypothetical protein